MVLKRVILHLMLVRFVLSLNIIAHRPGLPQLDHLLNEHQVLLLQASEFGLDAFMLPFVAFKLTPHLTVFFI